MRLLLIIAIMPGVMSYAQNWEIVKPGEKYNYRIGSDSVIKTTIWIDSKMQEGADSIYILNRVIEESDTNSGYVNRNPQFLQSRIRKTDSSNIFEGPEKFRLRPTAQVSNSWTFDESQGITAQVSNCYEDTVFGSADSVKVIALSTEDTILLSKNFGILRFDPVYENEAYHLAGINKKVGDSLPGFKEFFDFSVGDIFEYHGSSWLDPDMGQQNFISRIEITSKSEFEDRVEYDVQIARREAPFPVGSDLFLNNSSWQSSEDTWVFTNSPDHPTNLFHKQLIKVESFSDSECEGTTYEYSRVLIDKDSDGLYTKKAGDLGSYDYFSSVDSEPNSLLKYEGLCDEHEYIYKKGLGIVYYKNSGFEWSSERELHAYRKDNDTVGVFTGINEHQILSNSKQIRIYPNPSKGLIYIQSKRPQDIEQISIFNLNGQLVGNYHYSNPINIKGLKSGLYLIKVMTDDGVGYGRMLISPN